jgi:hypothetical protein
MPADPTWPPASLGGPPVVIPALDERAEAVWHALVALDDALAAPWCLIGGQMVVLHCLERDVAPPRPTEDGDVVVDVFARRAGLRLATQVLAGLGFSEETDSRGYGYRWTRGGAHVDVLVPERANAQRQPPRTQRGSRTVETPAAQQAIARAERVGVEVAGVTGYVARPSLLGAIVLKAAAAIADTRDPERHRQDIAVLCGLAAGSDLPVLAAAVTSKDRRRLRRLRDDLPPDSRVWRHAQDPLAAADAYALLVDE